MSLTLRPSKWIRPDAKHSDCEIDLKFLDYSTGRRTELADEPACPPASGRCGQVKPGQDGKPEFRFSDKPTLAPGRSKLAAAFARRNSNQTGDPKLFERSELSRFQPDRMRAQGGARPRQRYFLA